CQLGREEHERKKSNITLHASNLHAAIRSISWEIGGGLMAELILRTNRRALICSSTSLCREIWYGQNPGSSYECGVLSRMQKANLRPSHGMPSLWLPISPST